MGTASIEITNIGIPLRKVFGILSFILLCWKNFITFPLGAKPAGVTARAAPETVSAKPSAPSSGIRGREKPIRRPFFPSRSLPAALLGAKQPRCFSYAFSSATFIDPKYTPSPTASFPPSALLTFVLHTPYAPSPLRPVALTVRVTQPVSRFYRSGVRAVRNLNVVAVGVVYPKLHGFSVKLSGNTADFALKLSFSAVKVNFVLPFAPASLYASSVL